MSVGVIYTAKTTTPTNLTVHTMYVNSVLGVGFVGIGQANTGKARKGAECI